MKDVYPTVFEQAGCIVVGWINGLAWCTRQCHNTYCACNACTGVMLSLLEDLSRLQKRERRPTVRPS